MRAVERLQNGVDEVCCIFSSKDIVHSLFHAETLNVKLLLASAKLRRVPRATLPLNLSRDLKVDGHQSNFDVMSKQLLFFTCSSSFFAAFYLVN